MSDLGAAKGRVVIDTSDVRRAQQEVKQFSRDINQALGAIGVGVGVRQLADFAVKANEIATAFARQSVAARELAGSQGRVNELLRVYDRATGGVIDKAQALSDITRLMAVGFADSAGELDQFVRAVRGISIATGRPQEFVVTQLQLELLNQTGLRLDQVGLGMEEVRKRAEELKIANSNLTSEQAYQAAVLETANRKFSALTKSAEAQATGMEKLRKAWKDFQLEQGQNTGSALNIFAESGVQQLNNLSKMIDGLIDDIDRLKEAADKLNPGGRPTSGLSGFLSDAIVNWFTGDPLSDLVDEINKLTGLGPRPDFVPTQAGRQRTLTPPAATGGGFTDEQRQVIRDHYDTIAELEEQAFRDRQDATRQYEEQRTSTIRQYELSIAREAEDFALSRLRAEQDFQRSIERIQRDAKRRDERAAEDLVLALGRAVADSDERIADLREDAFERLAELDEDFKEDQARRERDFRDDQLSAAGRLDAIALLELRKDRARQLQDAKDAHDEQRQELQEQLDERIADEQEALEDRRQQAQEAHDRQLEDAREADRQRREDMQADFDLRKQREDEDREIRLRRMGEDFELQLAELERQHGLRIQQIIDQETRERAALQEQFNIALNDVGIRNDAWIAENKRVTDAAVLDFTRVTDAIARAARLAAGDVLGAVETGGSHPSTADPYIGRTAPIAPISRGSRGNTTIGGVQISVIAAPGQSPYDVAAEVRSQFTLLLEELAR